MKGSVSLLAVCSLIVSSISPVFADTAGSEMSDVITREKERITRSRESISKKRKRVAELSHAVQDVGEKIEDAKKSRAKNVIIFVPAAVITMASGLLVVKANLKGPLVKLSDVYGAVAGYMGVAVFGTTGAVTGYNVYLRSEEIEKFETEISTLKIEVNEILKALHSEEADAIDASRLICLIENTTAGSENCEQVYETEMKRLNSLADGNN